MDPRRLTWWLGITVFVAGIATGIYGSSRQDALGADGSFLMLTGPGLGLLLMVTAVAWSLYRAPLLPPVFMATTLLLSLVAGGIAASMVVEVADVRSDLTLALVGVAAVAIPVSVFALARPGHAAAAV